jgi:GNAT superfamily N-acetyltransferase
VAPGAGRAGELLIRPLEAERDAAPVVAIVREASPHRLVTAESFRHDIERVPERAEQRRWVAVESGDVIGWAIASRRWFTDPPDTVYVGVTVRAGRRRRGVGSLLYEVAESHALGLEPRGLYSWRTDAEESRRFAAQRGFRPVNVALRSRVDPRTVDLRPLDPLPDGVSVASLAELAGRLEDVFAVDAEASLDEPGSGQVTNRSYEEWLDEVADPLVSRDASFCALDRGAVVSYAQVYVDRESGRAGNGFTGTLRSHRGRGFATLAKLAAIRWLAEAGIRTLWTGNDETNAAMLAVNRRLGYVPAARDIEELREL